MAEPVIRRVQSYDLAAPGTDTDIFTAVTPSAGVYMWRVTIALAATNVLKVSATDGTTAHTWPLNSGTPLTAEHLHVLEFAVDSANSISYSLQIATTDGKIETLLVDELLTE